MLPNYGLAKRASYEHDAGGNRDGWGDLYGMKINKNKREYMQHRGGKVQFADGTRLKSQDEAKYLGCYLNKKCK